MDRKKFIYFDIGNVLMDFRYAMQKISDANNISIAELDQIYHKYGPAAERGDITLQDVWRKYEEELGVKAEANFDFLDYWTEHLLPIEDNHQALIEISQSHPVGILSNMYIDAIPLMMQKGKIPDANYTVIIESSSVGFIKPEEQIFKIAQESSGHSPSEIIYIDDRKDFVDYAKSLGWNSIWFDINTKTNLKHSLAQYLK